MYIAKPETNNPQQVGSVSRVVPVLPVGVINSPTQQLEAQAKAFTQGQTYSARVLQQVSAQNYLVELKNDTAQAVVLKMDLGLQAKVGQQLPLQFMHQHPVMTFMLKQSSATNTGATYTGATVNLSHTGSLLGQYLGQAESQHLSTRFEAINPITHFPYKPQLLANDLKQALSQSGAFYESHLQAASQGQYSFQQIRQEPQNQPGFNPANLMFQQLAVLEHQRFSWHGEVWPGQAMTWDVYQQRLPSDAEKSLQSADDLAMVGSELTIDFPHLGKVKAKISFFNGHMRIHFENNNADTLTEMQRQKAKLVENLHQRGQRLDGLTIGLEQT